tara:strand:- start:429 stop:587 length:159 start_codon:yes stop_codon:yes gene_type:complete
LLTFQNLKIFNQTEIDMREMIVLKTMREIASFSYLEVAWDISKIDISVGAAD